jgi:hypothetical protein
MRRNGAGASIPASITAAASAIIASPRRRVSAKLRPIGVIRAVGRSFALTRRRGLAMMALAAAVMLAGMLAPAPFRIIRDALQSAAAENPVTIALTEAIGSLLAAAVALAALLIEIALYRRLAGSSSGT